MAPGRFGGVPMPQGAPEPVETIEPAEEIPELKHDYEELPVNGELRRSIREINRILMAGRFAGEEQAAFDQYYRDYALARWTQVKDVASLPNFRQELQNQLRKKSAAATVHDHLNELVLEFMQNLASGPYHPAVQVNAMLMIGDLNSVEYPPTPLPKTLEVMVAAVNDAKLSDAVRAAAMIGIQRHAIAGIANEQARGALTTAMLELAAADLPAGAAEAGRGWIMGQAVETLGLLGSVGEGNAVFRLMVQKVSDSKLPFSARGMAAEGLGRLNYAGAVGINPVEAASALGQFAVDTCNEELRRSKDTGYPVSRRRLRQRLGAVQVALAGGEEGGSGIASLARAADQQAFVGELQKSVDDAIKVLDDRRSKDEDLEALVEKLRSTLEAWLKKQPK